METALSLLCLGLIAFGATGLAIQIAMVARRLLMLSHPTTIAANESTHEVTR